MGVLRRKIIPWTHFACAVRAHRYKADCIYLIPVICEDLPQDRSTQLCFFKRNYAELTRFEVTKNKLRAIKAYLPGLENEKLHIWSKQRTNNTCQLRRRIIRRRLFVERTVWQQTILVQRVLCRYGRTK